MDAIRPDTGASASAHPGSMISASGRGMAQHATSAAGGGSIACLRER